MWRVEIRQMQRYVRDSQLAARYDVDRATIWRWARAGVLPPPVKLSAKCTRWRLDEIERHEAKRAEEAGA